MSNVRVLGRFGWVEFDKVFKKNTPVFAISHDHTTNSLRAGLTVVDHFKKIKSLPVMEGYSYDKSTDNGYSNKVYFTASHQLLARHAMMDDNEEYACESGQFILDNFSTLDIYLKNTVSFNRTGIIDEHDSNLVERYVKNKRIGADLLNIENSNIARMVMRNLSSKTNGLFFCNDFNQMMIYEAVAISGGYSVYKIPNKMQFKILNAPEVKISIIKSNTTVKLDKIPFEEDNCQLHLIYNFEGNVWII